MLKRTTLGLVAIFCILPENPNSARGDTLFTDKEVQLSVSAANLHVFFPVLILRLRDHK